jgi:hypothetical protein
MAAPAPVTGFPLHSRRRTGSIAWPKRPNDASSHNLAGPPEKARPQAWEQPPLTLQVPKPNGQKRSN